MKLFGLTIAEIATLIALLSSGFGGVMFLFKAIVISPLDNSINELDKRVLVLERLGGKEMILPDKIYTVLKWLIVLVLPALSTFIGTIGELNGWVNTDAIVLTINAVTIFLGSITGISVLNRNKLKKGK